MNAKMIPTSYLKTFLNILLGPLSRGFVELHDAKSGEDPSASSGQDVGVRKVHPLVNESLKTIKCYITKMFEMEYFVFKNPTSKWVIASKPKLRLCNITGDTSTKSRKFKHFAGNITADQWRKL